MKALPCIQMMFFAVTGATVAVSSVAVAEEWMYSAPPPPFISSALSSVANTTPPHLKFPPTPQRLACLQGGRKDDFSVISQRTRELFQHATWAWVEHVFIFTVCYEGLGTRHPAVSLWAPKFHSTQLQLRSTRSCLIPFYKPNMTNNCIVYCLIPLSCHDSV